MGKLFINGKFYAGDLKGVPRVADRLIHKFDTHRQALSVSERLDTILFVPAKRHWSPTLSALRMVQKPSEHSKSGVQKSVPTGQKAGGC